MDEIGTIPVSNGIETENSDQIFGTGNEMFDSILIRIGINTEFAHPYLKPTIYLYYLDFYSFFSNIQFPSKSMSLKGEHPFL